MQGNFSFGLDIGDPEMGGVSSVDKVPGPKVQEAPRCQDVVNSLRPTLSTPIPQPFVVLLVVICRGCDLVYCESL